MIETNAVLRAVEAALGSSFPGEPVYWDQLPKNFARPSFTLEAQKEEWVDAAIGLVRRTLTVLVTGYAAADDYHDSSREELNRRESAVLALFGKGYLSLEDRALTVQANKGTGTPDFMEVSVVFSWMDSRPGYQDPETATEPKMGHFVFRVNGKD